MMILQRASCFRVFVFMARIICWKKLGFRVDRALKWASSSLKLAARWETRVSTRLISAAVGRRESQRRSTAAESGTLGRMDLRI